MKASPARPTFSRKVSRTPIKFVQSPPDNERPFPVLEDVAHGATPLSGTQPAYHPRLTVHVDGPPSPLPVPEQSSGAPPNRHPGVPPLFVSDTAPPASLAANQPGGSIPRYTDCEGDRTGTVAGGEP